MFYKVMKDGTVVDVLRNILYVKYQKKHDLILICDMKEAEAILSSDGNYGWHIEGLYYFWPDNHPYAVKKISKFEYDTLRKQLDEEE